jgi:hypothetical protein
MAYEPPSFMNGMTLFGRAVDFSSWRAFVSEQGVVYQWTFVALS